MNSVCVSHSSTATSLRQQISKLESQILSAEREERSRRIALRDVIPAPDELAKPVRPARRMRSQERSWRLFRARHACKFALHLAALGIAIASVAWFLSGQGVEPIEMIQAVAR